MGTGARPADVVGASVGATEVACAGFVRSAMSGGTDPSDGAGAAAFLRAGTDAAKAVPGDTGAGIAAPADGSAETAAPRSCRTSAARNTGPPTTRLATTAASAATRSAVMHQQRATRPAIPNRACGKRCGQERAALTVKTKVPDPAFVVGFNMLSWAVRPLDGCRESALPPGTERGPEARTVNSIRRIDSLAGLSPAGRRFCVVPHCIA